LRSKQSSESDSQVVFMNPPKNSQSNAYTNFIERRRKLFEMDSKINEIENSMDEESK